MTTVTLESWNINSAEDFIDNIAGLDVGKKYLLNLDKSGERDIIEKYVLEIIEFHASNKGIVLDAAGTHYIEFSIFNENIFVIDYEKPRKKYPVFSTMTYLDGVVGGSASGKCLIFTDTNLEAYKYKEFKEMEQMLCSIPQKNCHILFDSSKYYGFCGGSSSRKPLCLKINLWNIKPSGADFYVAAGAVSDAAGACSLIFEKQNDNICEETLITNKNILEQLLYNNAGEQIQEIDKIINKYTVSVTKSCLLLRRNPDLVNFPTTAAPPPENATKENLLIRINHKFKNLSYFDLKTKYGENAEDLKPFIDAGIAVSETNRFNKNVTIGNLLSKDVCYWIINEVMKINKWSTSSSYNNYSANLNVENIPAVLSYLLFVSNFWLQKIKEIYEVPDIDCNIKDMFISKYTKEEQVVGVSWNKDNTFLSLNIQLNDGVDFQGGGIEFIGGNGGGGDGGGVCFLEQGEALIYNGKKERTNGCVTDGEKYVLVILVELL